MSKQNQIRSVIVKKNLFKGFVSRANKLCSEKYIERELNFLIDLFLQNCQEWK